MAGTLTIIHKRKVLGNKIPFVFQFIPSGSYLNSGAIGSVGVAGEVLAFNNALNPAKIARPKIPSGVTATLLATADFTIESIPAGYTARVEKNAANPTANNYILRFFTAAGTELSSAPYPAALSGDATGVIIVAQVPYKYD